MKYFLQIQHIKKANVNKNKFRQKIKQEVVKRRKWLEEIDEECKKQGKN